MFSIIRRILSKGPFAQTHSVAYRTSRQSRTQPTESFAEFGCRTTITKPAAGTAAATAATAATT